MHCGYIFCFVLIDLIKGYKNHETVYSHSNLLEQWKCFIGIFVFLKSLCGICRMVFMCIVTFKNYCQYERVLWGILGDIEKCINSPGTLFKVFFLKCIRKKCAQFPNTHYCLLCEVKLLYRPKRFTDRPDKKANLYHLIKVLFTET